VRAAWRHEGAREGFEVVFAEDRAFDGATTAVEAGEAWHVGYAIRLRPDGTTQTARVTGRSQRGEHAVALEADGAGRWRVDGEAAPRLDGCLDVDLESSALTNAFPARRLKLRVGDSADAPAAYVRALDLRVERLEQRYTRLDAHRYRYRAPAFDFECEIVYDDAGLVLAYPGIATRVA
jgi:hypothetical protein